MPIRIIVFILLLFLVSPQLHAKETLHVAVASNFMLTAKQLIKEFSRLHNISTKVSFGSSGKLAAQIKNGAPFQVFLSADQKMPRYLAELGLAEPSSRFTYARGRLSLCSNTFISSVELSLRREDLSLAFANERLAPYGQAATQVLSRLKIIEQPDSRWVRAENVSHALQLLVTKNVNIALLATSLSKHAENFQSIYCLGVPSNLYSPILQDAILVKSKRGPTLAARKFLSYLKSSEGKSLINNFGYL